MKSRIIMVAAMLGLLATSCNKENDIQQQDLTQTPITISATYDSGGSKVSYSESGNTISATWQSGDKLLVVYNNNVNTLDLTAGAGTASATFSGTITGTPAEGATLVCYVKDQNTPAGTVTVNGDGSYIYTSDAFLGQDGTLAGAAKLNLYCGWTRYSSTSDINCTFSVNTSMMKFTVTAPDEVAAGTAGATLTYKSEDEAVAKATFSVGAGGINTVYLTIPSGHYSGTQTLTYKSGETESVYTLSSTQANFATGQTYSKEIIFGATNLADIRENYTAQNGEKLYGVLGSNVKISIAPNAIVTLIDVKINGTNDVNYPWAGITCLGNATIVLNGENDVKGFYENFPCLFVPSGSTLTIRGDGSLTASSMGKVAAGIGGGNGIDCGNINIEGGNIIGYGGMGAGIGCGKNANCGSIDISGGTVWATGGTYSAGIGGSQYPSTCGRITIYNTVTQVKAWKGPNVNLTNYSIGPGEGGSCGTITIGGVTTNPTTTTPYIYEP